MLGKACKLSATIVWVLSLDTLDTVAVEMAPVSVAKATSCRARPRP